MFKCLKVSKGMSLCCCFCWPDAQRLTFTLKKGQGSRAQECRGEPCARTCSAGDMGCSRPDRAPHLGHPSTGFISPLLSFEGRLISLAWGVGLVTVLASYSDCPLLGRSGPFARTLCQIPLPGPIPMCSEQTLCKRRHGSFLANVHLSFMLFLRHGHHPGAWVSRGTRG